MTSFRKLGRATPVGHVVPVHSATASPFRFWGAHAPASVGSGLGSSVRASGDASLGRSLAIAVVCAASLGLAHPAHAQTDSAAARALFAEGRNLMEDERYAEACPKFEESLRLDHGMGTQFNLAHCWEKVGRTASAWALFLDVAAAAKAGNQPQREAAARERAKAIEPRLTRLRIDLPNAPADAKVERDGQDVGKAAWGMAVPVDPGRHVIQVTAPGKNPWSDEVEVPATSRTFSVTVPALTDATAAIPVSEVDTPPSDSPPVEADVEAPRGSGSDNQRVAALVIGGVGLAAAATGTIFWLQSRSSNDEALELCHTLDENGVESCADETEQRRHEKLVDDATREQLIGFVGLGIGGAAFITAIVLYATSDGTGPREAAFDVAPLWTADVRGAAFTARF
jgi:hypothetical protein